MKTRPVLNCRLENVVVDEPPLHQLAFNQSDHAGSFCDPEPKARKEMGYVEGSDLALQIALRRSQDLSSAEVSDCERHSGLINSVIARIVILSSSPGTLVVLAISIAIDDVRARVKPLRKVSDSP